MTAALYTEYPDLDTEGPDVVKEGFNKIMKYLDGLEDRLMRVVVEKDP